MRPVCPVCKNYLYLMENKTTDATENYKCNNCETIWQLFHNPNDIFRKGDYLVQKIASI